MSLEIFSGTNLAPARGLADRTRREASKATSQPGFVLILPTFPETRLCSSQPCPITTLSWMSAPLRSPFPCSSRLVKRDIFGAGSWARGRPGTGSMNKGKTQQKGWKGTTRGEKLPQKSRSCPDTLRSVYKRFGLCAQQRTDSFSPLFSLGSGAHGRLHPGGIQALVDAPASKGSLGAVAGASRLKGTMCLCQGQLH